MVRDYGCDSLRLYELFVGPPELDAEWDDRGIEGVSRFLNRFWNLVMDSKDKDIQPTKEMIKLRHKLVYDIEQRFNQFSLNTVISGFMEYNNKFIELAKKEGGIDKETLKTFVTLLAPFAPHIGEELWSQLGGTDSVFHSQWPECDEEAMKDDEIEIAVQESYKNRLKAELQNADANPMTKSLQYVARRRYGVERKHSPRFVRPFEPYPDDCVVFRAGFDTFGIPWRFAG